MKKRIINILLWALRKAGYQIPVIKPVVVAFKDLQRVRAQEMIGYERMAEFTSTAEPDWLKDKIKRRVRETMAFKLAEMCEVREEPTPDGVKFTCDMLACNYPITPEP